MTRRDAALAGAGLAIVAAWAVFGFVDRDGVVRLVLSLALIALGAVLFVRLRRTATDRTWVGALVFILCGASGLADRAGAGELGTLLGWATFGVGVAMLVAWRSPRAS